MYPLQKEKKKAKHLLNTIINHSRNNKQPPHWHSKYIALKQAPRMT